MFLRWFCELAGKFGTIWAPGVLFRGVSPIFWPTYWSRRDKQCLAISIGYHSTFFTTKTPKNGQNKYLKCPKQVGIDSQDIFGQFCAQAAVMMSKFCCFFYFFSPKMAILPNMAKTVKMPLFHYFFAFYHILSRPYHEFSGHRQGS